MKDKFFKFFEIGKLDKGLFRLWIILSIVYFIIGFMYIKDTNYDIKNYSFYKNFNYKNQETHGNYCQKDTYRLCGTCKWIDEYGLPRTSHKFFSTNKYYDSIEECINETQLKLISARKGFITVSLLYILLPFFLALVFLILKKIFLWIYRGFK